MRLHAVPAILALAALPAALSAAQGAVLSGDLQVLPLGEGAFVVAHRFPFLSNSLLVRMPDGSFVLAGTPCTPEATERLLAWLRETFGPVPVTAVDTGYHPDNLGGNEALLRAGHPVYGSDLTVRLLRERGEAIRAVMLGYAGPPDSRFHQAYAGLRCVPPDHVFPIQDGLDLTFGCEPVQVLCPGPTQAPDKVAVYFPARRLLFGGCMILAGDRPGNLSEADPGQWREAVRRLLALPVEVVVAGHGERTDRGLLQHTLDLLSGLP
jgi:glyoxylase-like metal-dependent hydrolase (beta-lactamase superfamily II)